MAGTVLDSLVIKLALDGGAVTTGSKKAATSLKALEDSAGHTQNTLRDTGKAAADSFARARVEIVAMLALLTGGRSLKQAFSEVTTANAQLGNVAQNLNMDPSKLWAYGQMLRNMGGNADEAAAAIRKMQAMAYDPAQSGALSKAMMSLGVTDYLNPDGTIKQDVLARINKGIQGVNQQTRNHFLPELGISSDAFKSLEELNPKEFNRRFQFEQGNAPSREDIARAQHLKETIGELRDQTGRYGRDLVSELTPGLDMWLSKLTQIEAEHSKITGVISNLTSVMGDAGAVASTLATILGPLLAVKSIRQIAALKAASCGCDCPGGPGEKGNAGKTAKEAESEAERMGRKVSPYLAEGADAAGGGMTLSNLGMLATRLTGWGAVVYSALHTDSLNAGEGARVDRLRARGAFDPDPFGVFARSVASIESGGRYNVMGGSGGAYAGRYQMSRDAISDAAKRLHEAVPSQNQFLNDPAMQERFFRAYTDQNRSALMRDPLFRNLSEAQQYAVLGYAHNQGAGGARRWLDGGEAGHDGFGTAATRYSDDIMRAFANSGKQVADNTHHEYHINVTAQPGANGQQIARDIQHELHYAMPYPLLTSQG